VGVGLRCRWGSRRLERLAHAQQLTRHGDFDFIWKWLGGDFNVSQLAVEGRQFASQIHNPQLRERATMIAEDTLSLRDQSSPNSFALQIRLDGKHSDAANAGSDLASHLAEDCPLKRSLRFQQEERSTVKRRLNLCEGDSLVDEEKALYREGTVDQPH
jgi:hypothetical protein